MASRCSPTDMEREAWCPICLEFLKKPVTLDCGHNFCRGCITDYCNLWGRLGHLECPVCKAEIQKGNFRSNWQLAGLIEKMKQNLSDARKPKDLCSRHREELRFFCKDDEKLLCHICRQSPEHGCHSLLNLEEAARLYKDQICCCLETLMKEREKIWASKAATEWKSQEMIRQTRQEQEKTANAFKQLHSFLEVEERLLLGQMKEMEEEIARERNEHLASLSEELSSLETIIREMEEKFQQSASELLKDVRSTLERCEKEKVRNRVVFPLALQWRLWDFCDLNLFLDSTMKKFSDTLNCGHHLKKANVTLNPKTAHPKLILSENKKSVRQGEEAQALPDSPDRFDCLSAVLGFNGFRGGRHFWEVLVESEGEWMVGMTSVCVKRKGDITLSPEKDFWILGKWDVDHRASLKGHYPLLPLRGELKKIRVCLNYPAGRLAFFDADTEALLYEFSGASFSGDTLLPFFWVNEKGHLKISS